MTDMNNGERSPTGNITGDNRRTYTPDRDSEILDTQLFFKIMLTNFYGMARWSDINKHSQIFPRSFFTKSWLCNHKNRFVFFENNETIEYIAVYLRGARVCAYYNSNVDCNNRRCQYFHICSAFVTDSCQQTNEYCMRSHTFFDRHNIQLVRALQLLRFRNDQIANLVRCSSPEVCQQYNQGNEHDEQCCPYLHICEQYPRCHRTSCRLEHVCLTSTHNLNILKTFHLSHFHEYNLARVILGRRGLANDMSLENSKDTATIKAVPIVMPRGARTTVSKHIGGAPLPPIADGQYLCEKHIWDVCRNQTRCPHYHGYQRVPYQWQIELNQKWHDFTESANETTEELFCDLESSAQNICFNDLLYVDIDLISMTARVTNNESSIASVRVRRLSTMSYSEGKEDLSKLTFWCWYWCDDGHIWVMYDSPKQQYSLEMKYLFGQKEYVFERGQFYYKLTFGRNQQMFQQNTLTVKKRPVVRRPIFVSLGNAQAKNPPLDPGLLQQCPQDTYHVPLDWTPLDLVQPFELVSLEADSGAFLDVKRSFHYTLPETRYVITAIFRVQNPSMWDRHCCHQRSIEHTTDKEDTSDRVKVRMLFHGTDTEEVVTGICFNGFDPRLYGKNGTAYGKGAYFARKAHYSNHFTDAKGTRYMFRARVLVGQFTQGRPNLRRPPPRRGHLLYDSCVDDVDQPSIFVVFDKDKAYPENLIAYEKKKKEKTVFPNVKPVITVSAKSTQRPVSERSLPIPVSAQQIPSSISAQPITSSVNVQSIPNSVNSRPNPSSVSAQSIPNSVSTRSIPIPVSAPPIHRSVSAQPIPSSVSARPIPSSVSAQSIPSSVSARPIPSSVSAQSIPSSISARPIPSSVGAQPIPSSVSAQPIPSSVSARPIPSSVGAQSIPSSVSARPIPSSVSAQSIPSSISAQPIPSSVSARPIPSSVSAQSIPSSVSAQSIPSSVGAQPIPSSVSARPIPSSISARLIHRSVSARQMPNSVSPRPIASSVSSQSKPSFVSTRRIFSSVSAEQLTTSVSARPKPCSCLCLFVLLTLLIIIIIAITLYLYDILPQHRQYHHHYRRRF